MSAPYQFTPRLPAPPHSTPISASAHVSAKPKIPRAPIQNPYEKLTQTEFEAFIGDITGALRRALGQVDPDEKTTQHLLEERAEPITSDTLPKYGQIDLNDYEDEPTNDSFAEIKARRVGKGKARDPREGPGLGKGDRVQPIEIVSSDEEEEEEVKLAIGDDSNLSDEDDEEEVVSEDTEEEHGEEEEDEYLWERGQSSTQPLPSPRKRSRPEYEEDEEGEEEEEEEYEEYYDEEAEGEYEEEYSRPAQRHSKRAASPEIIDILSDEGEDSGHQQFREQSFEEEGEGGEYAEFSEEDEQETGQLDRDRRTNNHYRRSRDEHIDEEHAEEREEGQGVLEDDDETHEIQPQEEDTSFPPRSVLGQPRPVEIHDPWSGPRTYAEDFYSGGDLRLPLGSQVDPSHLGPMDDEYMVESIEEQQQHIREEEEIQPFDEDISFPPHIIVQHSPVDLPDPWEKPQEYAEDFYAQGDVRVLPGFPIDPSLLSGTADIDDSMENFLTPDVLTPNLNEMRSDFEDEEEKDLAIRPSSPQRGVSSLREEVAVRLEPEIITLDDESDEERDDREAAERWNRAYAEGEEEFDELDYEEDFMEQDFNDDEDVHQNGANQEEDEAEEDTMEIVPPPSAFTKRSERDPANGAAPIYSVVGAALSQDEVVSNLVDWNNPPAFTQGIPATASGHLVTPSSEEENGMLDDAVEGVAADEVPEVSSPSQDVPIAVEVEEGNLQETEDDARPPSGSTQQSTAQEVEEASASITSFGALPFLKCTPPAEVEDPEYFPAIVVREPVEQPVTECEREVEVGAHTTAVDQEAEMVAETEPTLIVHEDAVEEEKKTLSDIFSSYTPAAVFPELHENILTAPFVGGVTEPAGTSSQSEGPQTDTTAAEEQTLAVAPVVVEDDIRSTPGMDDHTQPVVSTVASTSHPSASSPHDYEQLPTPPSEQDFPSQTEVKPADAPILSSPEAHESKENEVSTDADDIYQSVQVEMEVNVEFDVRQEGSAEYTVVESGSTDDEVDRAEDAVSVDFSVVSMKDGWQKDGQEEDYVVEEPVTEGRLTEEPPDRAMSLDVASVGVGGTFEESLEVVQESKESEPVAEEIDQGLPSLPLPPRDEEPTTSQTEVVDELVSPASEVAIVVEALAISSNVANPPMILQKVPMPVRANADVPDPTSRSHTPRPDFTISLPGSPRFVLTPLTTPQPTGGPVPVSLSVPVAVLKTSHEHSQQPPSPGPSYLQQSTATRLDGLFTPAEPSLNGTPIEVPKDDPTLAFDRVSEVFSGPDTLPGPLEVDTADRDSIASTPPYSREVIALESLPVHSPRLGFDAGPERLSESHTHLELATDILDDIHKTEEPTVTAETLPAPERPEEPEPAQPEHEVLPPSSLPYRAPAIFADSGVKLTRKPTDPILMADPYPYSLSTPGASMEPQQYLGSDEDTGLDNSISSNSTLEKEFVEGKDPAILLDDDEELEFQYPPEVDTETTGASAPLQEVEQNLTPTQVEEEALGPSPTTEEAKHISLPSFEEILNAEDPFKLMGNDRTVAPGAVEERLGAKENGRKLEMQTNGTPEQTTISEKVSETRDAALTENTVTTPTIIPSAAQTPTAPSDSRPSKRKRDASPEAKALPASSKGKSRKASKSKGKAKEVQAPLPILPIQEAIHVRRPSGNIRELGAQEVPEVASQSSAVAAVTYRILQSGSRASSVASSGPSEHSVGTQPSPTVHKPHVSFEQAPPVHNLLLHAHGQKRQLAGQSNTVKPPKRPAKKATRSKPPAPSPAPLSTPVPPLDPALVPTLTPPPSHLFDRSMLRSLPSGSSATSFIIQPLSPFKSSLAAVPPPPPPPPPAQPPSLLHAHGRKRKQTAGNLRKSTLENADRKKPSAAKSKSSVETQAVVEPAPAPALVPTPVTIEDVFTVPTTAPQPIAESKEIHTEPEPIGKSAQSPAAEAETVPKAESPTPILPHESKPSESTSHDAVSPAVKDEPASTTLPTQVREHGDVSTASSTSTAIPPSTRAVPARQVSLSNPKTGSRSTRSQCRYHRISLPKEEGGPRVCFLVPGCSLNDRELMKEEEIEDHGDATHEDSLRMVKDIETLDFDQYLIGVLRHLVGLDIIREQEIYYLPQPGEAEVARRYPLKKLSIERPSLARGPGDSSSYAGSPGYSAYSASIRSPASVRAPPSIADSTSTSRSALRMLMDSEVGSSYVATDSEHDDSDYDEPERKRVKPSPPDDQGEAAAMGPPTKSKGKGKLKARKSKTKDVVYNPEKEDREGESMVEGPSRPRRRKSTATKRGLKRSRIANDAANGEEGSERQPKKLKMHATAPELLSPSKDQPQPQTHAPA
ncbi:unnamed protein product [Cyclocybe aegerita]|uniref:Uncharacterized protein n=1 Tax=Cyclocybe aegerita TaxID=1973307 RepID=A0A8S0WUQ3_CYCAE|nr:unnamed protein product [Cyclocybe aegerita]